MPEKLNDKEKMKAILSIWSNENKLSAAKYIRDNSPCNPSQIIDATGQISPLVSRNLKEMISVGVIEKAPYMNTDTRQVFYRITELGKKILSILD